MALFWWIAAILFLIISIKELIKPSKKNIYGKEYTKEGRIFVRFCSTVIIIGALLAIFQLIFKW
ncbi:hypothetical protein R70723_07525 [Paenibacillus sp. FSL R7-0273]|uniref:hypothetical protein n=1 Tax=Paenibacillus sp. FSL R7-0273 TaxID=1536772 RepID=UPI0004F78A91|nr:hypothetical protein [Paenibacillus sp. FSL R7-0273]AIQ45748.1 hypothetical protein R70723_07525 [Paenibacillus sp. FSL R7-0273]OMF95273.1 hypothetical protein BK144_07030 [Paenibacillus sp. FSL R7-0273]